MKTVAVLPGTKTVSDSRNRTHFAGIVRLGVLAVLATHSCTQDLSAKTQPPQTQHDASTKNAAGQSVAPAADSVTIPDGTLLPLQLRRDFSSATVKVGDTIEFTTAYPVRINGTAVVPQDAVASGTVAEILPPRRASRDARVYVTISKILLPDGQTATLRAQKSGNNNSRNAKEVGNHPSMWTDSSVNAGAVVPPTIVVGAFSEKGREWEYKAGSWTTVYFNGPLTLSRRALVNLEPPPYKGPAQVFVNGPKGKSVDLYLNRAAQQVMTGQVSLPVRIEFQPGRYSIRTHKKNGQAAELDVEKDHRYWIEYEHGRLSVEDPEPHRYEMEKLAVAPWVTHKIALGWFLPIVPVQP